MSMKFTHLQVVNGNKIENEDFWFSIVIIDKTKNGLFLFPLDKFLYRLDNAISKWKMENRLSKLHLDKYEDELNIYDFVKSEHYHSLLHTITDRNFWLLIDGTLPTNESTKIISKPVIQPIDIQDVVVDMKFETFNNWNDILDLIQKVELELN